jgi:hypothetical protein
MVADREYRRPDGTFKPGHKFAAGNPHQVAVGRLRARMYAAVSEDDLAEVIAQLVAGAKAGRLPYIKELLDRLLGRPYQALHLTGSGDAGDQEQALAGVSLGDIQLATWEVLADHPSLRVQLAQRLRELHERARDESADVD